jgi:aspartate carbamoyltransferase catalytic subunit
MVLMFDNLHSYTRPKVNARMAKMKSLISAKDISKADVVEIFGLAERILAQKILAQKVLNKKVLNKKTQEPKSEKSSLLRGRTVINLFFENSTRTRSSFELAGKRLGADVINISVANSSASKGESLLDTARTLNAMATDFLIIRHNKAGAPAMIAKAVDAFVINAGDGCNEHPTQALLDAFTLTQKLGDLNGKKIVICGDIRHSRVAHSNHHLLGMLGAEVVLCGPATLLPQQWQGNVSSDFDAAIIGADAVMTLRLQRERMQGSYVPSVREYFAGYALTRARLMTANPGCVILDPGPVMRGVSIESALVDDPTVSLILDQVEAGVAIRMAVLSKFSV